MQKTRWQILEILRERGDATVNQIVRDLTKQRGELITAVTVRHHLSKLQEDGFVTMPQMQHRSTPGRPRHIYTLTGSGETVFPNNYQQLSKNLIRVIENRIEPDEVNVIIEDVVNIMAEEAGEITGTLPERLEAVVTYLNNHGYEARWAHHEEGFVLETLNCPYHQVAQQTDTLCNMDMKLIARMLGVVPRLLSHISDGCETCAYLVPSKDKHTT